MFKKIIDKIFKKPQFNSVYAGPEYYKRKYNMGRVYAGPEIDDLMDNKPEEEVQSEPDGREYPKNYEAEDAPEKVDSDDKPEDDREPNDPKMLLVYAGPAYFRERSENGKVPPVVEKRKPSTVLEDGWICGDCGTKNTGDFCAECGRQSPQGENRQEIT